LAYAFGIEPGAEALAWDAGTGDLVSAGPGMVYRFVASGGTYDGEVELAFDGELASRMEFVTVAPE
jgi:hypothetical protein